MSATVIEGDGGAAVSFGPGTVPDALLEGFTIQRASHGISCIEASPTVRNCRIRWNGTWLPGGGIYCERGAPSFVNCDIRHNGAGDGGGAYLEDSEASFTNCTFASNVGNWGSALSVWSTTGVTVMLTSCAFIDNEGPYGTGAIGGYGNPHVEAVNCLIWDENPTEFAGGSLTASYCNIQGGWPGDTNIDADPQLTADFRHLQANSPCRDGGDPAMQSSFPDIDGEPRIGDGRVDIGADEFFDVDADGLPDWWEQAYFGSALAADPTLDEDNDGLTNEEEYVAVRDPHRPPCELYVDVAGDDSWDGLSRAWDGQHGPKATIQAALDATATYEHDTVTVADGIYVGPGNRDLDLMDHHIVLRSASSPENCIVDCEQARRGLTVGGRQQRNTVVRGFTIRNGLAGGGAVSCWYSSPTISECIMTHSVATTYGGAGGAVCCRGGSPLLDHCKITHNTNAYPWVQSGGGLYFSDSNPVITNCVVADNAADYGGGIYISGGSHATIANCIIRGNLASSGAGVYVHFNDPYAVATIANCSVVGNTSPMSGSGINVSGGGIHSVEVTNVIVWHNLNLDGVPNPYDQVVGAGALALNYSCVQNLPALGGEGNIDTDPQFVDLYGPDGLVGTDDDDLHLSPGSPCIDTGSSEAVPSYVTVDLGGSLRLVDGDADCDSVVDMGAYEVQLVEADCNGNGLPDECETDADSDGVINDCDSCPESDLSDTIVIDGCDTDVENLIFESGCTMADEIAVCADAATNHGEFVRCVAELTNEWRRAGLISGREKGRIQSCAAHADLPPEPDSSCVGASAPMQRRSTSPMRGR